MTLFKRFKARTENFVRIVTANTGKILYHKDLVEMESIRSGYWHPAPLGAEAVRGKNLDGLRRSVPGLVVENHLDRIEELRDCPFVFERPDAPHLLRFRKAYDFDRIVAGAKDEFQAILQLATWVGARWDHGTDEIPGGRPGMDLVDVVEAGQRGKRYWCEIAAVVTVQAFAAMGWPARMITASRNGYDWEHAVAEVWSNQFSKWIMIDADFNVLFERDNVPLSSFELCHDGPALQKQGAIRIRVLGQPKPSLPITDLIPFFEYVHIDLRSDWYSRRPRLGSPVSGDLSTWWTARPSFRPLLTPKIRVDDPVKFDWPVNIAWIRLLDVQPRDRSYAVRAGLLAYSPYFEGFSLSIDGAAWAPEARAELTLDLAPGNHELAVRVLTSTGTPGPENRIRLWLPPLPAARSGL